MNEVQSSNYTVREKGIAKRKIFIILCVILTIFLVCSTIYLLLIKKTNSLPISKYTKQLNYQLYYPSTIPQDYAIDTASINTANNMIFYGLKKGNNTISISEQSHPTTIPDFTKLQDTLGFKKIDIPNGMAVVGLNIDKPTAIMLTNTTLINIYANKEVPTDIVIELIKNMRPI